MPRYYCPFCGKQASHIIEGVTKCNTFGWTSINLTCIVCDMLFEVWEWPESVKATQLVEDSDDDLINTGAFLKWKS